MELAQVAHVAISESDAEAYARELDAMRALADALQDVPYEEDRFLGAVSLVELREDLPMPCLAREEILKMAPAADEEGILVPRVVEA